MQCLQILRSLLEAERQLLRDSNHVPLIQRMIEGIWKYNNLDIEWDVNYTNNLDAVISTAAYLPLFAYVKIVAIKSKIGLFSQVISPAHPMI